MRAFNLCFFRPFIAQRFFKRTSWFLQFWGIRNQFTLKSLRCQEKHHGHRRKWCWSFYSKNQGTRILFLCSVRVIWLFAFISLHFFYEQSHIIRQDFYSCGIIMNGLYLTLLWFGLVHGFSFQAPSFCCINSAIL